MDTGKIITTFTSLSCVPLAFKYMEVLLLVLFSCFKMIPWVLGMCLTEVGVGGWVSELLAHPALIRKAEASLSTLQERREVVWK